MKQKPSKDILEKLYLIDRIADVEIAKMFGVVDSTISYWRKGYGIKTLTQMDRITEVSSRNGLLDIAKTSKEEFQNIYNSQGASKMSKLFGCSKPLILRKVKEFNLSPLSKMDRIEKRCPKEFTELQKNLLYGSLLGDGNVYRVKTVSRFKEHHCRDQKGYLEWKHEILKPFSYKIHSSDKIMPSGFLAKGFAFHSCFHPLFNEYRDLFYHKGEKRLPEDFEDRINPFILSVWYMDDGHLDGFDKKGYVTIASCFPQEDMERVVKSLNQMDLDVCSHFYGNQSRGINIIRIHEADKFFELTKEQIVDCMRYKIPLRLGGVRKEDLGLGEVCYD